MKKTLKNFLLLIIILIASLVASPYVGRFYEIFFNISVPGGWIGSCPECWEGFLIGFSFFAGLFFAGLRLKGEKLTVAFVFTFIPLFIFLMTLFIGPLLLAVIFGLAGLGLGQVIYLVRTKCCKVKEECKK